MTSEVKVNNKEKRKDKRKEIFRFFDALRSMTPNGADLTDEQLIALWGEPRYEYRVTYGKESCACGHDISHVFSIRLKSNPSVVLMPVGSECVKRFYPDSDVKSAVSLADALKRIQEALCARFNRYGAYLLNEDFVCKENGFTRDSVDWLKYRLWSADGRFLGELFKRRNVTEKTPNQLVYLEAIARRVLEALRRSHSLAV